MYNNVSSHLHSLLDWTFYRFKQRSTSDDESFDHQLQLSRQLRLRLWYNSVLSARNSVCLSIIHCPQVTQNEANLQQVFCSKQKVMTVQYPAATFAAVRKIPVPEIPPKSPNVGKRIRRRQVIKHK